MRRLRDKCWTFSLLAVLNTTKKLILTSWDFKFSFWTIVRIPKNVASQGSEYPVQLRKYFHFDFVILYNGGLRTSEDQIKADLEIFKSIKSLSFIFELAKFFLKRTFAANTFPFFLMLLSKSPTWEFIWSMFWNSGRFRFQLSLEIIWFLMKIIDLIVSCNLSLFETLFFSFLLVFCAIAPLLPFISRWWKMAIFSNSVKLP